MVPFVIADERSQQSTLRDPKSLEIVTWIEKKYHRQRRMRRLEKLTPVEFEALDKAMTAAGNYTEKPATKPTGVPHDYQPKGEGYRRHPARVQLVQPFRYRQPGTLTMKAKPNSCRGLLPSVPRTDTGI